MMGRLRGEGWMDGCCGEGSVGEDGEEEGVGGKDVGMSISDVSARLVFD